MLKASKGLRWGYIYINKGITDALVLTVYELRNFNYLSRNKAMGTPHRVYYIQPSLASDISAFVGREVKLYTHSRGDFSIARFDR